MNTRIRKNIAKMSAYVPGEQPSDPSVIKLNTNENPYPPSPAVLETLRQSSPDGLRLYPDPVSSRLRAAIASMHGCDQEQVFCGNGSDEILALCVRAFVENHGKIGYFDPSYSLYPVLAHIADAGTEPLNLEPDFTWPPIPDQYDVPLFFWTNPNAPTSLLCPAEPIRAYAERSEGVVVVDEAYVAFADADCSALALSLPNLLVTRSLSKSHSLAGIRLGYAIGHAELIAALYKIKDAYNINRLTQELGRVAVEDHAHMEENVRRIVETRERVAGALRASGYAVCSSQTNFLWIRPPSDPAEELFARLRERGILVRHFPGRNTRDYLRVTVGTDDQMNAFLSALDVHT